MGPDDDDGEEIGFDDSEELDESDLVTLVSEDGEQLVCVLLAVVEHDGVSYAVLTPQTGEDDEVGDILLATFDEDAVGGARFGPIEDDAVVRALKQVVKDLVDLEDDEPDTGPFGGPVPEA